MEIESKARYNNMNCCSVTIKGLVGVLAFAATMIGGPITQQVVFDGHLLGTLTIATQYDPTSSYPGNAFMLAAFEAMNGSLDGTATQIGGNHFNWLQIVTAGTPGPGITPQNVPYPFVDTLSGGKSSSAGQTSDRLPYYWSETGGEDSQLTTATDGNKLGFSDQPVNLASTTFRFDTFLVDARNAPAQTTPSSFIVLAGFSWTFNENAKGNGSTIGDVALFEPNDAFINSTLALPYNFPGWSTEATTAVPEPRFLLLIPLLGLLALWRTGFRQ